MEVTLQRTWNQPISDPRLLGLAKEAAIVYNAALNKFYEKLDEGTFLGMFKLQEELREIKSHSLYSNSHLAAMQQFSKAFASYLQAKKAYEKDPSCFSGKPMPPKREKETQTVFWKNPDLRLRDGFLILPLAKGNDPIKVRWDIKLGKPIWAAINWNPHAGWELHLVMERRFEQVRLDPNKMIGIDLGVKRIATTCDDEGRIVTYSGKIPKSLVREREKLKADTQSKQAGLTKHSHNYRRLRRGLRQKLRRNSNRMHDFLHKVARTMVNECVKYGIGTAVIGDCATIHDAPNFGKINNQAISQNPEQKLRKYFEDKFLAIGGKTQSIPENYTSKTCPKCGKLNDPNNRDYKCKCGFKYDRDGVGALNIWGLGRNVSLGGALSAIGRRGLLTRPTGWKYKSSRDCHADPLWVGIRRTPRL